MNRTVARALLLDAFSQVMDNKVFRLLVLVSITLIAPAFLIGFRPDGIQLLFGWKFFSYKEFLDAFHFPMPQVKDLHIVVIQKLQEMIVQGLAGSLGILFCIAATAFFVPRMLEKGAADTLFTKPISRSVLLLSRYFAGLIFVGTLSFILVLGIHVGLLVVSGYSDPAFLWCTLTLVYIYALVQTVSVAVGVFTRSSVAAILCTLIFFTFNGCIHGMWREGEWRSEQQLSERDTDSPEPVRKLASDLPILRLLQTVLDGLHYTLPKTHDADVLTRKMRTVFAGHSTVLEDPKGQLAVDRDPDGFRLEMTPSMSDLLQSPATWVSKRSDGSEAGRMTLSRRSRLVERPPPSGRKEDKPRTTLQSTNRAASEFLKTLETRPKIIEKPVTDHERSNPFSFDVVRWSEEAPAGKLARERLFFAVGDWMYELDVSTRPGELEGDDQGSRVRDFMGGLRVTRSDAAYLDTDKWYEARFAWSAPLKFNAFFSILSSLAFAILMLAVASWRLARIDF